MGFLSWIWDGLMSIFGPEPEPEPEPDIIEAVIETPGEIWRAVTGEAKEEWREEKVEAEQRSIDDIFAGEWEAGKREGLHELSDEDLRQLYGEYIGV